MSAILLDTNALLWLVTDSSLLGVRTREELQTSDRVLFSSVSILELRIKEMLGRFELPGSPLEAARAAGLPELSFSAAHAEAVSRFPALAKHDPFDRMLLAQAATESCVLVTSDRVLLNFDTEVMVRSARD